MELGLQHSGRNHRPADPSLRLAVGVPALGCPLGSEGYSGRFAPLIYDVVIEGEHQTYTLGQVRPTVYLPGDMASLASAITTMDYRSVRRQFWEYTRICTREMLRGHFI